MWDHLETFYKIIKIGNLTQAAEELDVHQSTLTRSLQKLEKSIGFKLCHRGQKGLALTRKGEELFEFSERMLMELASMKKQIREQSGINGKIRISTTHALANYVLGAHLLEFNKLYPDIFFEIVCNDHVVDIIKNDVDVAIRPYDSEAVNLIQVPLFKLQAKLYASQEYIDKHGFPETKQDLKNHKFIAFSRPGTLPYAAVDWFLNLEGHTSQKNCILRVNSVEMHHKAAQEGLGIIVGYEQMDILKASKLINVAPNIKGPMYADYLIYPGNLKKLRRIKLLEEFLIKKFKE